MKYPKVIGIYFGDNDYYNTFIPFLHAIGEVGIDEYEFTKESFVKLANETLFSFYLIYQHRQRDGIDKYYNYTRDKYLKLEERHVHFDDEVASLLEKHKGWCNSELFVIDTTAHDRKPYIYSA